MRLLLTAHNAQLEGASMNVVRIAHALMKRGNSCHVIAPQRGPLEHYARTLNVPLDVLPGLYDTPDSSGLIQFARAFAPDAVLVKTVLGGAIVQEIKKHLPDMPMMWNIHESEANQLIKIRPHIDEETFAMADSIVFGSNPTQRAYEHLLNGRGEVIYTSVDVDAVDSFLQTHVKSTLRAQHGLPSGAFISLLVGTICPRKGQREFIESAVRIMEHPDAQDSDPHFLLAGKLWPSYQPYLQNALAPAQAAKIMDRIHVIPEKENVFDLYALSDVLVCNSFIESFPTVVIEAMGFGLPVAASKCYGVQEQIRHGENGLLHLSGHSGMLAENLLSLMRDPVSRMQYGKQARADVERYFSSAIMGEQYESAFQRVLNDRQNAPKARSE